MVNLCGEDAAASPLPAATPDEFLRDAEVEGASDEPALMPPKLNRVSQNDTPNEGDDPVLAGDDDDRSI